MLLSTKLTGGTSLTADHVQQTTHKLYQTEICQHITLPVNEATLISMIR